MSSSLGRVVNHAWDRQTKHLTNVIYPFWKLIQATHFTGRETEVWKKKKSDPLQIPQRVCGKGRTKVPTCPDPMALFTGPWAPPKTSVHGKFHQPLQVEIFHQNPAFVDFMNSIRYSLPALTQWKALPATTGMETLTFLRWVPVPLPGLQTGASPGAEAPLWLSPAASPSLLRLPGNPSALRYLLLAPSIYELATEKEKPSAPFREHERP